MRVITPAIKLDVKLAESSVVDGNIVMSGMSGVMVCETVMPPAELFHMMRLILKPQIIKLLIASLFSREKKPAA